MRAALLYLLALSLTVGCATRKERRCHRAAKKVERASELCPVAFGVDTIHLFDTVYVDGVFRVDTFVTKEVDTVRIDTGRLRVQVVRRWDTLYVDAACDPDTIVTYRTIEVPAIDVEKLNPGVSPNWRVVALVLGGLLLLIVLGLIIRK